MPLASSSYVYTRGLADGRFVYVSVDSPPGSLFT
jgi:hypothetical protein